MRYMILDWTLFPVPRRWRFIRRVLCPVLRCRSLVYSTFRVRTDRGRTYWVYFSPRRRFYQYRCYLHWVVVVPP